MSRSKGILLILLACFMLSTIMTRAVNADGCTPSPSTGICITTDKTTYSPGEGVIVTVEAIVSPNTPSVTASIVIFSSPPPYCGLCGATWGTATLHPSTTSGVWTGTVGMWLPTWLGSNKVAAGNYTVEVFGNPPLSASAYAAVAITVTGQTPVPESPSVLGLLLPALLVGIYVLRRKKSR